MNEYGKLFLIPVPIADISLSACLPEDNLKIIKSIKYFIVEQVKTARRFLKKVDSSIDINSITFYELNKHTDRSCIEQYIRPIFDGYDVGVISEAGCPAIADPGADIVAIAQRNGFVVIPLVGPSSIILSLMGSGFNGQRFRFVGYLPIDDKERIQMLSYMERIVQQTGETQLFIETPYRNNKLLKDLIQHCNNGTMLSIALHITAPNQFIVTKPISWWRKFNKELPKEPAIFLLGKS